MIKPIMNKLFSVIVIVVLSSSFVFSQKTNDDGGNKNSNNEGNVPKENTDKNNNDPGNNTCMNTAMQLTGIFFGKYQTNLLSSGKSNPTVSSFELLVHAGAVNDINNTMLFVPRLKIHYGAISGDFRYSYFTNKYGSTDFLDFIADFNIIPGKLFKMSIGQGLMYIMDESGKTYHESYIGIDWGFSDRKILISPEFRLAYDWNIEKPANSELTIRGGYRILGTSFFDCYANIAGAYQYISGSDSRTLLYGGLNVFIH